MRQISERVEKLFTFETDISRLRHEIESSDFRLGERDISLTLELQRRASTLRAIIRIKLNSLQLDLRLGTITAVLAEKDVE